MLSEFVIVYPKYFNFNTGVVFFTTVDSENTSDSEIMFKGELLHVSFIDATFSYVYSLYVINVNEIAAFRQCITLKILVFRATHTENPGLTL